MGLYTYEDNSILRTVVQWLTNIIVTVAFAWFLVYGVLGQEMVSGHSMLPTLAAEDMCLVNRLCYDIGNPKRFDVVVFEREDTKQTNIKRVIGLPGDTVQIVGGSVYINNRKLDDPHIGAVSLPGLAENPVELQKGEYFLLGDNADSSEDSRFANIGNVKRENIKGKVWFRLKPFKNLGFID
ncbi:MAG: signal peptidase I [Eubacteriales bacterium]|nr:signal peptidase I [Eubacteriales bacterium]